MGNISTTEDGSGNIAQHVYVQNADSISSAVASGNSYCDYLVLAGSGTTKNMAQATAGVFYFTPGAARKISELTIFIVDNAATNNVAEFGGLSALANGLLLHSIVSGVTTTIANLQDNMDLACVFNDSSYGEDLAGNWFEEGDLFTATFKFPVALQLGATDQIAAKLQDDLSGLDHLRIMAKSYA